MFLFQDHVVPWKGYTCMHTFNASLRFVLYGQDLKTTVILWIPSCLWVRKEISPFAQSIVCRHPLAVASAHTQLKCARNLGDVT